MPAPASEPGGTGLPAPQKAADEDPMKAIQDALKREAEGGKKP
jgi:hypothetical protein